MITRNFFFGILENEGGIRNIDDLWSKIERIKEQKVKMRF